MVNEKQIYKDSLLEVVNYLNKNDDENEVYSKKSIRLAHKNKKIKRAKIIDHSELKDCKTVCQNKTEKIKNFNNDKSNKENTNLNTNNSKKSPDSTCKHLKENNTQKLTRKERKILKIKSKGEGISSKEYMKIVKEKEGKKLQVDKKLFNKNHMPTKIKDEYPKREIIEKRQLKKYKNIKKNYK